MRVSIEGALERHGRLAAVGSREIAESFHSRKVAASGPAIDRQLPNRDEDDDIPVVSGSAVVFLRTLPHTPLIKIWAEVAVKVSDLKHTKFEVEVLNRARPFAKFVLVDDRVVAQVHLLAAPLVPEHLRQTLAMMCELAAEVDGDPVVRVSGRRFLVVRRVVGTVKAPLIAVKIGSVSGTQSLSVSRMQLCGLAAGPAMRGRNHLRDACGLSDPLRQPELGVDALAEGDVVGRS